MSHSTTSGGVCACAARGTRAARPRPAAPVMPRIVARRSIGVPARRRHGARARRSRAAAASAARASRGPRASSSAVIVAKSFFCRISRDENVSAASSSISRSSGASFGFACGNIACASRAGISGRPLRFAGARMRLRQQRRDHLLAAASDCARRGRTPARTARRCSRRETSTAASAARKSCDGRGRPLRPRRARR